MKLFTFTLLYLSILNMSLAVASSCPEDQLKTRIDFEQGQIQRICQATPSSAGFVMAATALKAENLKYENQFTLLDTSAKGLTKAQIKTANLFNLEEKWVKGKMTVVDGDGHVYPVGIKETLWVTKYLAEAKQGKKMKQPTAKEEEAMDQSINNIKGAIETNLDSAVKAYENAPPENATRKRPGESDEEFLTNMEHLNNLTKKDYKGSVPFTKAIDTVSSMASATSTIVVAMIDANPSAYPIASLNYQGGHGAITGPTLTIKTSAGNLFCSGMSQDNNMPLNAQVAKIDWNFAPMTLFQYSCNGSTCTALVDTNTTNNVCSNTADKIFAGGFEETER